MLQIIEVRPLDPPPRVCSSTNTQRTLKKQVSEPVELALNKPSPDMWDQILVTFKDALAKAEATYTRKAQSAPT
jgi:hypothetical protein